MYHIESAHIPGSSPLPSVPGRRRCPARLVALWLVLALGVLLSGGASTPSLALASGPCTMELLVDGRPGPEYLARDKTYIEALAGREYAVRLTIRTDRRIAVALSVDGLNSIDAKVTSADGASKWILGPYQSLTIDGWQTSAQTARKFFFTSESRSYGAWLGKTRNLGVVAAAVFREKLPPLPKPCGDHLPCPYSGGRDNEDSRARKPVRQRADADAQDAPAAPPAANAPADPSLAEPDREARAEARDQLEALGYSESLKDERRDGNKRALSDELAATGIGRELEHRVVRVPFDAEGHPAALMEVRYEYRNALVKLGVLPCAQEYGCGDRLAQRERAHGFTDGGFAPDPYRRHR